MSEFILPSALHPGDKVAMISPATKVKELYVDGAFNWFHDHGLNPIIYDFALHHTSGSFAASTDHRLLDLVHALLDNSVKCIFCNRGGYGVQQLLPYLNTDLIRRNPKWLVGFSDISALHALWNRAGVISLHAPMAKHLSLLPEDSCSIQELRILEGAIPGGKNGYHCAPHHLNVEGEVCGPLIGGNLAVLNGLASTPFDVLERNFSRGKILFIEDIGENIYEIDRILTRLYMSGTLLQIEGLIVGHFNDYGEDLNYNSMEEMISFRLKRLGVHIPVAFGFEAGHKDQNLPLLLGADVKLSVNKNGTTLKFLQ